jgi:hypothetical protein
MYLRRSAVLVVALLWAFVLLAGYGSATGATAGVTASASLSGTWSGTYSGSYSGTFRLHWTQSGSKLIGSITLSNPKGKYAIGGSVRGKAIQFGAVGAGATYTGSVSGKSMAGHYKSPGGGGTWSAHKVS